LTIGFKLDDQVLVKQPDAAVAAGAAREQAPESLHIVATGHVEAVRRHRAGLVGGVRGDRRLEDGLHRTDPRLVGLVEQQPATPPQQVREAGLMGRGLQIAIRMPAVALHDARIVVPDHRRRLRQPRPGKIA